MSSEVLKPLLWIVLIVGACVWGIVANDVVLGLDLQGGVTLRYELELPEESTAADAAGLGSMIETTIDTLRKRTDAYGIRESSITQQGENEIVVELPGRGKDEAEAIKSAIATQGRLEWRIVLHEEGEGKFYNRNEAGQPEGGYDVQHDVRLSTQRERLDEHLAQHTGKGPDEIDLAPLELVFDDVRYRWVPYSDEILARHRGLTELEDDEVFAEAPLTSHDFVLTLVETGRSRTFTGGDVAQAGSDVDPGRGAVVTVEMKRSRATDFGDWTEEYDKEFLGIVLDGRMEQEPARINGRLEGRFSIYSGKPGGFSREEIQQYVTIIRSGSLQLKPRLLYEHTVGPSLGESSIKTGSQALVYGTIAVVLFTLFYYRFNGLIAVMCLVVNMTMLAGLLMTIRATVTLPGLAGLVLTIGMAVDGNILVFERLREESDKAKSMGQAVRLGFKHATSTILDANVTTFVTAFILYKLGTGPVRGFAVVLMLGILTSVFSVLVFGRTLYLALIEKNWLPSVAMARVIRNDTSVAFMRKGRLALKLSAVAVVVSLVGFALAGRDPYGLDFLGGYKAHVRLSESMAQGAMKAAVDQVFPGAQVVSILGGQGAGGDTAREFVIKVKGDPSAYTTLASAATPAPVDDERLVERFEAPLREALAGKLLPDFATGLELVPDEAAATTGIATTLHFTGPVDPDALAQQLAFLSGLEVEAQGPTAVRVSGALPGTGFDRPRVAQRLRSAIDDAVEDGVLPAPSQPFEESTTIGSRVGTELRDSALRAVILSFVAIIIYIRVRFKEYRYGVAAVIALAHDVAITLGLVALVHRFGAVDIEIDLPMIAAFLTIVGYSLNDTIVVFDRVRENLPRIDKPLDEVFDLSINQTLSRTLLTSTTTLLVLVIIFYLSRVSDQHTLEGFSFAMIIGVVVGTYSSIFIASPIVTMLAGRRRGEVAG